jgi:hypothetical protein
MLAAEQETIPAIPDVLSMRTRANNSPGLYEIGRKSLLPTHSITHISSGPGLYWRGEGSIDPPRTIINGADFGDRAAAQCARAFNMGNDALRAPVTRDIAEQEEAATLTAKTSI